MARTPDSWHALGIEEVLDRLGANAESGLEPNEAARRAREVGPNALEQKPGPGALRQFLRQFTDVTVLALIAAAAIAIVMALIHRGHAGPLERFGDAIAIGLIVVMNAVIGFAQERRAASALRALSDMTAPSAEVLRGGEAVTVPASGLVPGDVVLLKQGDRVPADVRLIEETDFSATEAALTGESNASRKDTLGVLPDDTPLADRSNMAFMGTHVATGRARAVVVATAMATELGRIAGMLSEVETPETPLQRELRRFGLYVVIGCAAVGALVFVIGLWRFHESLRFVLLTAVSLAVAAIPEGLPAITTVVLALGVQRMARRHALVRRLAAVETLGAAHVICTDKTGTLTQNRMVVRRLWVDGRTFLVEGELAGEGGQLADAPSARLVGAEPDEEPSPTSGRRVPLTELLVASGFAPGASVVESQGARSVRGDPTDAALLTLHEAYRGTVGHDHEPLSEVPFDGQRKMATVVVRTRGQGLRGYTHGAPERILEHARAVLDENGRERALDADEVARLHELIDDWAGAGLRVLALARRDTEADDLPRDRAGLVQRYERELTLIGFVGIADPPRPEARAAVETAKRAGVRTVMITGDHPLTARAIGSELGLIEPDGEVLSGSEIDRMSDDELERHARHVCAVARATAHNKLRLVQTMTRSGDVVAMTGDGVNDAPAIKAASIGIAMGRTGTDVAREAADMVLADDNYATIVAAVEEGRIIYSNIKRFIVFLFAANAGLVFAVFIAAMLGWPPILTPAQILWINLITNGLPALALGMEPVHLDPMLEPPRSRSAPLVDRGELRWLLGYGAWMAALGLGAFGWCLAHAGGGLTYFELERARTLTFTVLAVSPLFHALNSRSHTRSVFALGFWSNWRLLGSFAVAAALQAVAVYVPIVEIVFGTRALSALELGVALGLSSTVWIAGELVKLGKRRLGGGVSGTREAPR
jgi:P-type Ca2+ transporter type 2C